MKSVLVIGAGSIGERHLRCFKATGRCHVSACEPNAVLRTRIAAQYLCDGYSSLEEALSAETWHAAIICTPAHTHIPIAQRCVESGVNILIEKPLATSLEGIEALNTNIESRGVVARVAYVHRSIPVLLATREVILSGAIGDVRHVVVTAGQNFPLARPAYASTYYANHSTGGGCIQDALTHSLHTAEWMVGPIESVYCDASHEALKDVEVEDTVNLTARMGERIPAIFSMNQFQAPGELTFTFHALNGSVRAELHNNRLGIHHMGEDGWKWQQFPVEERDAMFVRQASAFLDLLDGKASALTTLKEGLQTLKVNLAALKSSATRKEVLL